MKKLFLFLLSFLLTGCLKPSQPEIISKTSKELILTIVHINPPKHVVIDMVDEQGNNYQHRSKHCNIYRQYKVGSKYKITMNETIYTTKNGSQLSRTFSICSSYPVIPA